MQIKPVKNYNTPLYPTITTIDNTEHLRKRIPSRWKKTSAWSQILALGFCIRSLIAGDLKIQSMG